jgi:hypothetical protein
MKTKAEQLIDSVNEDNYPFNPAIVDRGTYHAVKRAAEESFDGVYSVEYIEETKENGFLFRVKLHSPSGPTETIRVKGFGKPEVWDRNTKSWRKSGPITVDPITDTGSYESMNEKNFVINLDSSEYKILQRVGGRHYSSTTIKPSKSGGLYPIKLHSGEAKNLLKYISDTYDSFGPHMSDEDSETYVGLLDKLKAIAGKDKSVESIIDKVVEGASIEEVLEDLTEKPSRFSRNRAADGANTTSDKIKELLSQNKDVLNPFDRFGNPIVYVTKNGNAYCAEDAMKYIGSNFTDALHDPLVDYRSYEGTDPVYCEMGDLIGGEETSSDLD